jgi:N-acetylmuramic acid 6-phosphate etherase
MEPGWGGQDEAADREHLRDLADRLELLVTEALHPDASGLDTLDSLALVRFINTEDAGVAAAVERVLPQVAEAVDRITGALDSGGRLFYLGAGTSGRLGVLDASECPPTFGTDPSLVTGIIAGGTGSLVRSSEGIEDEGDRGWHDLQEAGAAEGDVVVGITASTRTPYVVEALHQARYAGLTTIYVTCNPGGAPGVRADVTINPVVGPEAVAGSTRMKAGTATKMVLNMLTTASFVRMGRAYGNLMVDVRPTSDKLRARARRIVMLSCGVGFDEADAALRATDENVKAAILVLRGGLDPETALREASVPGLSLRQRLGGRAPDYLEGSDEPGGGADREG